MHVSGIAVSELEYKQSRIYVTLILGRDDLSNMIREVIEHTLSIVEREYGLNVEYRVITKDNSMPYMIINDLEPLKLDRVPSISDLLNTLLMIAEVSHIQIFEPRKAEVLI